MADERIIEIVIKGKNLTRADFAAARKELRDLEKAQGSTEQSSKSLGQSFVGAGGAAATFRNQVATMASAFTLASIIEKGVGALFSFGQEAIASAGNLIDLRAATGNSLDALQRWTHIAEQGGVQLENLTKGSFQLGAKLSSGPASVREAVERLGLSFSTLRNLKPEDQMDQIMRAAEAMGPSQERNNILIEFFGEKGALALAKIVDGWSKTSDAAKRAGDQQVEAIDRAADAWTGFKRSISTGFAQAMGNIVLGFTETGASVESLTEKERQHYLALRKTGGEGLFLIEVAAKRAAAEKAALPVAQAAAQAQRDYAAELQKTADQVRAIDAPTRRQIAAAMELGVKTEELSDRYGVSEQALKMLATTQRDSEAVAKRASEAAARAAKESVIWGEGLSDLDHLLADNNVTIGEYVTQAYSAADATADLWEQFHRLSGEVQTIGPALLTSTMNLGSMFVPLKAGIQDAKVSVGGLGASIKYGLGSALQGIPATLARAFEGGGDWMGAIKSIGSQVGSALGGSVGMFFGGPMGAALGQAVGSLAGPLIGKIGSLFTSQNTAEVKKYNTEIGKVRDSLLATYGPLDQLEAKAQTVGLSFKAAWGHQGKAGLEAMNTIAQEFKTRWDNLNGSLATSRGELDGLIKQGADLGYNFDATGKLVSVSTEKMREVAGKFGLDLKALGPSFDQAGLRTRMEDVINGFTLMDKAGTSTGTILSGMKDEINAIVNDSIKFKTDIPENMKPWIANLIETGQLTDANGDKINDMAGIKFGAPVQTEFEKISTSIIDLIASIQTLVDRISDIAKAAGDIPQVEAPWSGWGDPPEMPDYEGFDGGGRERSHGFARGTFGTTGIDFPDFGSGTRAVLHNRESVVPYEDRIATAKRWLGGAAMAASVATAVVPAPNVYIVGDTSQGARQVSEAEFRQIQDRLNGGGLTVPVRAISQRGR